MSFWFLKSLKKKSRAEEIAEETLNIMRNMQEIQRQQFYEEKTRHDREEQRRVCEEEQKKTELLKQQQKEEMLKIEEAKRRQDEAIKAAHALNLCTTSITQIIDYNDVRFMEQEYDNILNNLNIENMPKDETLLDILKQILDIINFFKIQEKEKIMLDREYQQKTKDAVWSAIPNPMVVISGGASGGLLGVVASLVMTVGTGYMNYRKEKTKNDREYDKKQWELERNLIEQLHSLQRQLFETAWRLADYYKYDGKLRLSEKQIRQYNEIILDKDPLRRYERLEYIKEYYEAYPPFWYFIGSAALEYARCESDNIAISNKYILLAKTHFETYFYKSRENEKLLREDPMVAQCGFEYIVAIDELSERKLVTVDIISEKAKILNSIEASCHSSLDVMQQCAIIYLTMGGEYEKKAYSLMQMLINEGYNISVNAQFLSSHYVKKIIEGENKYREDYCVLENKVPYVKLYPLPPVGFDGSERAKNDMEKSFLHNQKRMLLERYATVLDRFIHQNENSFYDIWESDYDITEELIEFFEMLHSSSAVLLGHSSAGVKNALETSLNKCIKSITTERFRSYLFNYTVRNADHSINYSQFTEEMYLYLVKQIKNGVECINDMNDLSGVESALLKFCDENEISAEMDSDINYKPRKSDIKSIEYILTGKTVAEVKKDVAIDDKYKKLLADVKDVMITDPKQVIFFVYDDDNGLLDAYMRENKAIINRIQNSGEKVMAVIKDKDKPWLGHYYDLIFTNKNAYVLKHRERHLDETPFKVSYSELRVSPNGKKLINGLGTVVYDEKGVDYYKVEQLTEHLLKLDKESAPKTYNKNGKDISNIVKVEIENSIKKLGSIDATYNGSGTTRTQPFKMTIENIGLSTEYGIAVKGIVNRGIIKYGDCVEIERKSGQVLNAKALKLHDGDKYLDEASMGMEISILLCDVKKEDISVGDVVIIRK